MWPFSWFRLKWQERLSDAQVLERYRKAGAIFGDAVSYIYMGECIGFKKLHAEWARWELEASHRGFRTFSVDSFVSLGGYGTEVEGFGERRVDGEEPILHAERYREAYLGKVKPVLNLNAMMSGGGPQVMEYVRPSTEETDATETPYRD